MQQKEGKEMANPPPPPVGEDLLAQLRANGISRGLEEEDEFGFRPLHEACSTGNTVVVQRLLDWGADIHATSGDRKSTPLHIAAEYKKEDVVALLLQKGAAQDLLQGDHEGDTPLHIAADQLAILTQMFDAAPQLLSDKPILNGKKQNLLHYAAGKGSLEVVDFLIKKGVDKFARDYKGATPFHFAARGGSLSVMEKLMIDVDDVNYAGLTALHFAAWNGHNDVVNWLLDHKASTSKIEKSKGNTPLHFAAINGSAKVIRSLIEKGSADVCATANNKGDFPVDVAQGSAVVAICKAMIKSRVFDLMARNNDGTLLHYAAAYADGEDVRWVLSQIRDITARTIDGKGKNFLKNVNSKDQNGQSALHWAASEGNYTVIEPLINQGVKPFAKDNQGRSPLCLALIDNQVEFAEKLLVCLGEKSTAKGWPDWANVIQLWTASFKKEIDKQFFESFKAHMPGYSEEQIMKEVPPIYKALYAHKQNTAKFIQEKNNEFVNTKGEITGRTALHWATILKRKDIVSMLCNYKEFSKDLIADILDHQKKTPLDYATEVEIIKELRKRPEVQYHVDNLYRDRQVYVDVSNAILVGAALIASVTFEKWFQPPTTDAEEAFWILNSLSFFFSIAAVVAGGRAMLPVPDRDIGISVANIQRSLKSAALLLVFSILFVLGAFTAGWFVAWPPPSFKKKKRMLSTLVLGMVVCLIYIAKFVLQLFRPNPKEKLPHDSPVTPQVQGDHSDDGLETEVADKLGKRHDYIPWDDGLDNY